MKAGYVLALTDTPAPDDIQTVNEGLGAVNAPYLGEQKPTPLAIFARDKAGKVVGGLIGDTNWDWLHISILWLQEDERRSGVGRDLMLMGEEEARRRGCKYAFLETFSFQAPEFYRKLGYTVFGQLDNLPPGQQWFYMKKDLFENADC